VEEVVEDGGGPSKPVEDDVRLDFVDDGTASPA